MDGFSDIESSSSDIGTEVNEVETPDADFGDGDGVNDFDDTYESMNNGDETMEYSQETSENQEPAEKNNEDTETAVDEQLNNFDDVDESAETTESPDVTPAGDNVEQTPSGMTTDENVDDALSDFEDDETGKSDTDATADETGESDTETTTDETGESDAESTSDESATEDATDETEEVDAQEDTTDEIGEADTEDATYEIEEADAQGDTADEADIEDTADETEESDTEDTVDETDESAIEESDTDGTNNEDAVDVAEEASESAADSQDGETEASNIDGTNDGSNDGTDSNTDAERDHTEKNAVFENVSYHQGQNDLGALGTCGPTSIANSLNRVTGSTEYTENKVLHNAMDNNLCRKSDNPYSCGGTTTRDVVNIIDNVKNPDDHIHTEIYEYDKALSVDDLANRLDDPGTVAMVGVDSATLWDQRGDVACSGLFQHTDAPSDHWITVDSPIRDEAGNLTGFNIIDSGGGVSEVSREKFEAMYMGDAGHTVSDPTAILISNSGDGGNKFSTSEDAERTLNYKGSSMESDGGDPPAEASAYSDFKSLSTDEQIEKFANMSNAEIYDMVKNSSESWPVDGYDKVTPENAKDFIVLNANDNGETSFNIDWPKYGGYDPKTISPISNLNGKVEVSRDGGDGGYTMGIGRNADGSYDNNSMRSIPKSSAEVNTGTFDVDKYKESVDIVSSDATDEEKTVKLMDMGFDEDSADNMLRDYENWKSRPEIIGNGNIEQGAKMANPDGQIDMKYGVHGKAAEWNIGGVHMEGGAGQMNTVYSWGTCRDAGIITNCGKAKID